MDLTKLKQLNSLKLDYSAQHCKLAASRTELIHRLSYKQYKAARARGFFTVELVPKVTKNKKLVALSLEVILMREQMEVVGLQIDALIQELK